MWPFDALSSMSPYNAVPSSALGSAAAATGSAAANPDPSVQPVGSRLHHVMV